MDELPPPSQRFTLPLERFRSALRPRRFKKGMIGLAKIAGLGTVFVSSLAGAIVLHLPTSEARSAARIVVNSLLAEPFKGRIELGEIEALSLTHARVREARVFDAAGEEVIHARGVDADIDTATLLRSLLASEGSLVLRIPRVRIERAHVTLRPDTQMIPSIAEAFLPRVKSAPGPPGRPTVVDVASATIDATTVSGSVGAPLEAELGLIEASVFVRDDQIVAIDVAQTGITLRELLPAELRGVVDYRFRVDLRSDEARRAELASGLEQRERILMHARFGGLLANVPASIDATLEGVVLDANVDLPHIEPASVREIFPWFPLNTVGRGRARVSGELPLHIAIDGAVELQQGDASSTLLVDGGVSASDQVRIQLGIHGDGIDPRSLHAQAPHASLDVDTRLSLVLSPRDPEPRVSLELSTGPWELEGQAIPALDAVIDIQRGEVIASATLHETGMPIEAQVSVKDGRVAFSAIASSANLRDTPRLAGRVQGSLFARIDGELEDERLTANISATGRGVGTMGAPGSTVVADGVTALVQVSGRLTDLHIRSQTNAHGVTAFGERLESVKIGANGSVLAPHVTLRVEDPRRGLIDAQGLVSLGEQRATGIQFSVEREGESAHGKIATVGFGRRLSVQGVAVTGGSIGTLGGSVEIEGSELLGHLRAEQLDLGRVQRLFGLPGQLSGVANVELHIDRTPRGRKGSIELELQDGSVASYSRVSARVSVQLDGERVLGSGFVRLSDVASDERSLAAATKEGPGAILCDGPIAELRFANADAVVAGPLLAAATWRKATGTIDIAADHLDLGCIHRRLGEQSPLDRARGVLSARFRIQRDQGDEHPSVKDLRVSSAGLDLKRGAWESSDLDVALKGFFDGKRGASQLALSVHDSALLLRADAHAELDVQALLAGGEERARTIANLPFELLVTVPSRTLGGFATLPRPLRELVPAISGQVAGTLQISGSPRQPFAFARVTALDLRAPATAQGDSWVPALDVDISARYDPELGWGVASATASTTSGALLAQAIASVEAPIAGQVALVDGAQAPHAALPWRADVGAQFFGFPLQSLPALIDRELAGTVSGWAHIQGINDKPSAALGVTIPDLRVHGVGLSAQLGGGTEPASQGRAGGSLGAPATLWLKVEGKEGGSISATASGSMDWQSSLYPVPDPTRPGNLAVNVEDFPLAAFYPLVHGTLSKLQGTLDGGCALDESGNAQNTLDEPATEPGETGVPACTSADDLVVTWGDLNAVDKGSITLAKLGIENLVAYVPALGQELHSGRATILASTPATDGQQTIAIRGLEAQGASGRVMGRAKATLQHLALRSAAGELLIPEDEELPITLEGVSFGKASGKVTFDARFGSNPEKAAEVNVEVTDTIFSLPASIGKNVQSMDAAPGVTIVPAIDKPKAARARDAPVYVVKVRLGETEVRSSILNVRLRSGGKDAAAAAEPLQFVLADKLRASGEIVLLRGNVVVNKKKFEIDRGLLRLRAADSSNPYVNLNAHWEGPNETRVFVEYTGLLMPITDEKIRFYSDPPRSQEDILVGLVFGDGSGSGGPAFAGVLGNLGGTLAESFANDLIGTFSERLSISVGTSESGSSVGGRYAFSETLAVGGGVKESSETGADPQQRAGSCGDAYVEWRFRPRWSLRGSGGVCGYEGDGGSEDTVGFSLGIDALWQYRY